jgi:hypothetical protein
MTVMLLHNQNSPEPKSSVVRDLAPEPTFSETLGEPTILKWWFKISPRANLFMVWVRGFGGTWEPTILKMVRKGDARIQITLLEWVLPTKPHW